MRSNVEYIYNLKIAEFAVNEEQLEMSSTITTQEILFRKPCSKQSLHWGEDPGFGESWPLENMCCKQ